MGTFGVIGIVLGIVIPIITVVVVIIAMVFLIVRITKNANENAKATYFQKREEFFRDGGGAMQAWVEPRAFVEFKKGYQSNMGSGILELRDHQLMFTPKNWGQPAWVVPTDTVYVGTAPEIVPALYVYQEQLGHLTIFLSFKRIHRARSKDNTDWMAESGLADDMVQLIFRAGGHPLPEEFQIRRSRYGL